MNDTKPPEHFGKSIEALSNKTVAYMIADIASVLWSKEKMLITNDKRVEFLKILLAEWNERKLLLEAEESDEN